MVIAMVMDPNKRVTDALVLKRLAEQGIDKDYVEFFQDYAPRSLGKGHSPYAKFYRDLKSNKRFMVVSGLPMVKPDGIKIEVGWIKQGNKYAAKANLFSAIVEGKQVRVTCLSDQPSGIKKDAQVIWNPQLFLDGIEQTCGKATLLETDPTNPNYQQNTLEWDYGVCKRRSRVIEGRIREKWIFNSDPQGEVRIKHNTSGNYPMRYGSGHDAEGNRIEVQVVGDEEIVSIQTFRDAIYPVSIGASPETFYPDAHVETTSVDGDLFRNGVDENWATIRAGAGTLSRDDSVYLNIAQIWASTTNNQWFRIARSIELLDTSGLPDTAVKIGAVFSILGNGKSDGLSASPTLNVYGSTPASNDELVNADYAQVGSTAYSDAPIAYTDFDTAGYNDFALNATGLAAIPLDGVTKLGCREASYDITGSTPNWVSEGQVYFNGWSTDKGAGFKPKLVVTYTIPGVSAQAFMHMQRLRRQG